MKKYLLFWPITNIGLNLWDQAYLLGCINNLQDWKVLLLASKEAKLDFIIWYKNISILQRENWKLKDMLLLINIFRIWKIDTIYHVGADWLDGKWWKMDYIRIAIFLMSIFIAQKTKIVSFSFTKTFFKRNKYILKYLSKYAYFYPRDSISMNRFIKEYNPKNISLASDTSFLAKKQDYIPKPIHDWIKAQKKQNKKIIIFCPANRPSIKNITKFLKDIAQELNSWNNWSVCIVQHIFEKETEETCKHLLNLITQDKISVNIQDVNVVRKITAEVDMVASCLMHCALWAVATWTPVVVLDYFWKATWLFQDLGLGKYVCSDESKFIQHLREIRDNREMAKVKIQKWYKIAQERALKIFRD